MSSLRIRHVVIALVLVLTATAFARPESFKQVLSRVRDTHAELRKKTDAYHVGKLDRFDAMEGIKASVQMRMDLKDLCERTHRHLGDETSLYVETRKLIADGWTFAEVPKIEARNAMEDRARKGCFVATHRADPDAEPGLVVRVEQFEQRCLTDLDGPKWETYPFRTIDRTVECRKIDDLLQAHIDTWLHEHEGGEETTGPKKKGTGIAKWYAAATHAPEGGAAVKREWYAWSGESFSFLHDGATFVAIVTYTGAAIEDRASPKQVAALLGRVKQTLK